MENNKKIVFITDCTDAAYNELRGVVLSNIEYGVMIEPVVPVAPFSIINGNFIIRLMAESYPEGTIFSVILNPMKERPARLIGKTKKKGFYFMGANTGAFTWFFRDFGIEEIYELNDPGFYPFGGKYVHAPAVSQIAMGKPLNEMGHPFDIEKLVNIDATKGTVVNVDNFGLMKFISDPINAKEGDKFKIVVNNKKIQVVFAKRMMSMETGQWVVYPGSSLGLMELGKVREDGASILGVKPGDVIKFV